MKEMKTERRELAPKTPEMVNPFQTMRRFTKDMERLFEDFGAFSFPNLLSGDVAPLYKEFAKAEWVPRIEVLQNNGQFVVRAELPGLTKDDVNVEMTENSMLLSGERKEENEEKREGFYRSERSYGKFYREIRLPEGMETENATATFRNGVLEITMPIPKAEKTSRKLEIKELIKEKAANAAA